MFFNAERRLRMQPEYSCEVSMPWFPKKNEQIWCNWSAIPRLRILIDRKGYTNEQVRKYLIKRFGWSRNSCMRNLQYQVSHYKRYSVDRKNIWRSYLRWKKDNKLKKIQQSMQMVEFKDPQKKPRKINRYAEANQIKKRFERGGMERLDEFISSGLTEVPAHYTRKHVWSDEGAYLAFVPPYPTPQRDESVAV